MDNEDASYFWDRCYSCGHRLRFEATGCPQCGIHFKDSSHEPEVFPELCTCNRCVEARKEK